MRRIRVTGGTVPVTIARLEHMQDWTMVDLNPMHGASDAKSRPSVTGRV